MPARRDQPFVLLQALCLFSCNFLCFYKAAAFIPSELISVIFSLARILNAVNARLFFGDPISRRALVAALLGASGLGLLFGTDVAHGLDGSTLTGIGLAALGTLFFSFGNMVSRRNSAAGLAPVVASGWGMAYGALVLLALIALTGTPIVAPPGGRYVAALVYLAAIGSVVGFTTYLMLVARIGSARAAYATVLFPIVALTLSSLFESYQWTATGLLGLLLTLAGNAVMFTGPKAPARPLAPAARASV
ncbi:hypothetical protein M673_01815 [Aureimonas sp. AU20]|nr:hypothetical protein M673_01815 [Aureimonas sp. AU20]